MRIVDVTATILFDSEFPRGGTVLVRVKSDDGLEGIGEAVCYSLFGEEAAAVKVIITKGLRNVVRGMNPEEVGVIWEKMYDSTFYNARPRDISTNAISGVDMAIIDLLGKIEKKPAHTLLGGKFRDKVRLYASGHFDSKRPSITLQTAERYLKEGFTAMKFGSADFGERVADDILLVRKLKDLLGDDADLMIDGPRSLSYPKALSVGRELEKLGIAWWEEPIAPENLEGYSKLAGDLSIPIAMGECERTRFGFVELINRKAADILQADIAWVGGLTEAKRIAELAGAFNIPFVPHNWSTFIDVAAGVHLAASTKNGLLCEYPIGPRTSEDQKKGRPSSLMTELTKEPLEIQEGYAVVSDRPGLGVELDEEAVKKYTVVS